MFLERMMNMQKERIDRIKALADRLADYINEEDSRLFKRLFFSRRAYEFRTELIKAANASTEILMLTEEFEALFFLDTDEEDTDRQFPRPDFYMARDLLFVRLIEKLHELGWYQVNTHLAKEVDEELNTLENK
jgi:hypothetical protein